MGRAVRVMTLAKGLAVLALLLFPPLANAQETSVLQSTVLTIDSERLFAGSLFGQRVTREFETKSRELEAENSRIEADLIAEEKELTEKRGTLPNEEFRALADAFDQKVELIRLQQNTKARELTQGLDVGRRDFLNAVQPILASIMTQANAAIIVEQRSVFLSRLSIDVTNLAIEQLNEQIGEGTDRLDETTQPTDQSPQDAQ